jgi:hypothetical protein
MSHSSQSTGTCTQCSYNSGIARIHEFIHSKIHDETALDHHYIWNGPTASTSHGDMTRWNELIRIANIYSTGRDEMYVKYRVGYHIKHCILPIIGNFTQADVSPLGDIEPDNQLLNEIYRPAGWSDVEILVAKMVRYGSRQLNIPTKKTMY